ncbi:outer membrane beta-barrel protein [Sunxiuqinia rutila]|uniref:outer membrane beta-barrel protein n=1 Tax=Sunxiuqinia rutila TaxID=1397841 RepID=UPI003D36D3CB
MKHRYHNLLLLLLLFLISQSAFSQRAMDLSFTGSPSINWFSSDTEGVESGKVAMGFDYGVNADFYFDAENKYAISTGLIVNNVGAKLSYYNPMGDIQFAGESFASGTSFRYRLKYVEVPLMIKLHTSQFQRWSYWGQFGFSSFVNIQAKGDSSDGRFDKHKINDEVKLFNLALNIGIGSNFDLGGDNAIALGLVYKNGFMDVTSNDQFEDKTTLNSLVLKLGLIF